MKFGRGVLLCLTFSRKSKGPFAENGSVERRFSVASVNGLGKTCQCHDEDKHANYNIADTFIFTSHGNYFLIFFLLEPGEKKTDAE